MSDGPERRSRPHELTLHVREEDIDGLGHVNNVVYLSWIQDVAKAHWLSVASPEQIAETSGSSSGTNSTTSGRPISGTKSSRARGSATPHPPPGIATPRSSGRMTTRFWRGPEASTAR